MAKIVVFIPFVIFFSMISVAVRYHFDVETMTSRMKVISMLSLVNFSITAYGIFAWDHQLAQVVISLMIVLLAMILFIWTFIYTRGRQMGLAFFKKKPDSLLESGPFNYVRHPFYLSYMIYWIGCCVITFNLAVAVFTLIIAAMYVIAARNEEREIMNSELGTKYRDYTQRVGFIFPFKF